MNATERKVVLTVAESLPLEIAWLLESIDDDLTMLEHMTDLPRRRDALVRKASRTLAAIAEITLGHELLAEDWHSVLESLRSYASGALARHRCEHGVESLLDLDLVAQQTSRAADVARSTLQEYFTMISTPHRAA
jgi:hypothetical protein